MAKCMAAESVQSAPVRGCWNLVDDKLARPTCLSACCNEVFARHPRMHEPKVSQLSGETTSQTLQCMALRSISRRDELQWLHCGLRVAQEGRLHHVETRGETGLPAAANSVDDTPYLGTMTSARNSGTV